MHYNLAILFVLIGTAMIFATPYTQQADALASPLKQIQSKVPVQKIQCKEGFVLIIGQDGSPACVAVSTSKKLVAQGWTIPQNTGLKTIPKSTGYLGGSFTSFGKVFALSTVGTNSGVSNPSIQQGSSGGFLSFLFSSSSYSSSAFSVSYQSCSRSFIAASGGTSGISGLHQSCTPVKSLGFSYGKNSQGLYAVTTKSVTLPCSNVQTIGGQSLPMKYDLVTFSVKTTNSPSATPFSYDYVVYAHC